MCALGMAAIGVVISGPVSAHIVPPDEYHRVAEAQRKIAFFVNLNPVLWDLVETEAAAIAKGYDGIAGTEGEEYWAQMQGLFDAIGHEVGDGFPTPTLRKQTAREVFEYSTKAVARLIELHLRAAEGHLTDYETAAAGFDAARGIWEAFAHEVKATDPEAFRRIGRAWLEASSALGYPGVLGVGIQPPDSEVFSTASGTIRAYLFENFGEAFDAPERGTLPSPDLTVSLRGVYRSRYGDYDRNGNLVLDDATEYVAGHALWHVTFTHAVTDWLTLQGGVKNLFDYTDPVRVPSQPGRLWFGGLRLAASAH